MQHKDILDAEAQKIDSANSTLKDNLIQEAKPEIDLEINLRNALKAATLLVDKFCKTEKEKVFLLEDKRADMIAIPGAALCKKYNINPLEWAPELLFGLGIIIYLDDCNTRMQQLADMIKEKKAIEAGQKKNNV